MSALEPFWWQLFQRALLTLCLVDRDGGEVVYALDVRRWGKQGGKAHLFLNGRDLPSSRSRRSSRS